METVKTPLEAQQFAGLTKEDLLGNMLYAAATGYFAANDVNLNILNRAGQVLAGVVKITGIGSILSSRNDMIFIPYWLHAG